MGADPVLAHNVKFMKLAKMAVLSRKLKFVKNFFFSKVALIYDYFMLSLSNFAQTNSCAAMGADSQNR